MKLFIRKILGFLSNIYPGAWGYSCCGRCGITWRFVVGHSTDVGDGGGMFPLCEHCWKELSIKQRLPYYSALYDSWCISGSSRHSWSDIQDAVLRGG